jgi:beta-galactosidase
MAVDARGARVPDTANLVRFTIGGAGTLSATANGDPTSHDSFQSAQVKVFHGQCLLIVRSIESSRGPIHITAESDGLQSASIEIMAE